ncbi:MAG TPA: methionyl-tRNA formyltransferase [Chloroflexia bacterium]|nr:methionyl-tRNA formyltransferase [Chloroflexia bacterium]
MEPLIFMGTPEFAVPALQRLAAAGYPCTVVTQPDRPAGRSGALQPPPVKQAAAALGLPVWQPATLRDPAVVERIRALAPAAIVVVAYGEILRPAVLDVPAHGCLNLHPSLLPRWRGPTPMNAAILAGDTKTGVSVIQMDAGMDSGPLLAQEEAPLYPNDTTASLSARLAEHGARLLAETVGQVLRGAAIPRPQPAQGMTICRLLRKEDGRLDWTAPAAELERQVRAYDPWPGTYTTWAGRRLKVLATRVLGDAAAAELGSDNRPGTVSRVPGATGPAGPAVRCGQGWLELTGVQLEGKPATGAGAFLRGYPALVGAVLA